MLHRFTLSTHRWFDVIPDRPHLTPGSTKAWVKIEPSSIQIARFKTTQSRIGLDGLWSAFRKRLSKSGDHYIFLVLHSGEYRIDDGHHRLVVEILKRRKTVPARVFIDNGV